MNGIPAFHLAAVQSLLVAVIILTGPMVYAFGSRVKMDGGDMLLLVPIYPTFAALTLLLFWPFEANWGDTAFGPLGAVRGVIVGGAAVVLGTILTQRHQLMKLNADGAIRRLAWVFGVGAIWGLTWSMAGLVLTFWGMK